MIVLQTFIIIEAKSSLAVDYEELELLDDPTQEYFSVGRDELHLEVLGLDIPDDLGALLRERRHPSIAVLPIHSVKERVLLEHTQVDFGVVRSVAQSLPRVSLDQLLDDVLGVGGQGLVQLVVALNDALEYHVVVALVEQVLASEQFVDYDPQTPEIAAEVDVVVLEHLRGHVIGRPHEALPVLEILFVVDQEVGQPRRPQHLLVGGRQFRRRQQNCFGDIARLWSVLLPDQFVFGVKLVVHSMVVDDLGRPEVDDLNPPVYVKDEILRFEVSVQDALLSQSLQDDN